MPWACSQAFVGHLCVYAFLTASNLFFLRTFRCMRVKPSVIPWIIILNNTAP